MGLRTYLSMIVYLGGPLLARQHELGLTLGGLLSQDRGNAATHLTLGSGIALQANYGYRVFSEEKVALYGEVHLPTNPLRDITSVNRSATRERCDTVCDVWRAREGLSTIARPSYFALGGGYALYEQSTDHLAGASNRAPRFLNRATLDFGGGADVRLGVSSRSGARSAISLRAAQPIACHSSQYSITRWREGESSCAFDRDSP